MKLLFAALFAIAVFSCQKKIEAPGESINGDVVESQNGVYLEPCHSTSFVTSYPVQAGKVPPFKFTKTHYPSGRVRTINMLTRAHPIHAAFKPQAWEVIGTFTYNLKDVAYFTGTKQLWEYYRTSTGASARRSIVKKNMKLTFYFFTEEHYAAPVGTVNLVSNELARKDIVLWLSPWFVEFYVGESSDEPALNWRGGEDYVNHKLIFESDVYPADPDYYKLKKRLTFGLEPESLAVNNLSYQPTQNWISLEFTQCEVMNWLPPQFHGHTQRKSVAVMFYPYGNGASVVQSQVYKNHKYDAKGNLLSYTYGDAVLQKTTWLCK